MDTLQGEETPVLVFDIIFNCMDEEKPKDQEPLIENIDFYWENGFLVFTENYHLKRGYCCGNGCRHCPYGTRKKSNQDKDR
jgi:hypothetical protein